MQWLINANNTHTRPLQTQQRSTFIAKDNHYVLFCKISFRTDPVNLFRFGFNMSAEQKFIAGFYTILFMSRPLYYNLNVPYLLYFASTGLQESLKPAKFMAWFGTASNHNLLYSNL